MDWRVPSSSSSLTLAFFFSFLGFGASESDEDLDRDLFPDLLLEEPLLSKILPDNSLKGVMGNSAWDILDP